MMLLIVATGCDDRMEVTADMDAPIYPDYRDVTIPVNIAPLNFLVRDSLCRDVRVYANNELLCEQSGNEATFDIVEPVHIRCNLHPVDASRFHNHHHNPIYNLSNQFFNPLIL